MDIDALDPAAALTGIEHRAVHQRIDGRVEIGVTGRLSDAVLDVPVAGALVAPRTVLEALEKGEREGGGSRKAVIDDLPLFAATAEPQPAKVQASEVEARLQDVLPDELTPKDALALVYELREMLGKPG